MTKITNFEKVSKWNRWQSNLKAQKFLYLQKYSNLAHDKILF